MTHVIHMECNDQDELAHEIANEWPHLKLVDVTPTDLDWVPSALMDLMGSKEDLEEYLDYFNLVDDYAVEVA